MLDKITPAKSFFSVQNPTLEEPDLLAYGESLFFHREARCAFYLLMERAWSPQRGKMKLIGEESFYNRLILSQYQTCARRSLPELEEEDLLVDSKQKRKPKIICLQRRQLVPQWCQRDCKRLPFCIWLIIPLQTLLTLSPLFIQVEIGLDNFAGFFSGNHSKRSHKKWPKFETLT